MHAFGERTGVTSNAPARRYLWTDAFAVCNYLALHQQTGAALWLERVHQLISHVHHVLGRHRPDDRRTGWISGLDEVDGARHPTAGGLRIGKPLPERGRTDRPDERIDWDRDGQYYHYVTRWLHALTRTSRVTADSELLRYAVELASVAHRAFCHEVAGEKRLYWKLSIDLSQPVVSSMGQHDALDGLAVTAAIAAEQPQDLQGPLRDLRDMCTQRGWATSDALGIGGLLTDALILAQLIGAVPEVSAQLLERVLRDAARSLDLVTMGRYMEDPAHSRLPFRELGLSLGLAAVERLDEMRRRGTLPGAANVAASMDALVRHVPLRTQIEAFWLEPAHQRVDTWRDHEDINAVMLATSVLPDGYLDR